MLRIEENDCYNCSLCSSVCPKKCIDFRKTNHGFMHPTIDKDSCIECGLCEKFCPALNPIEVFPRKNTIGFKNNNKQILLNSSSGGAFYYIAEYVLKNHGSVYGASYNESLEVSHVRINKIKDLYKLMKSKYVMSRISCELYSMILKDLSDDNLVLFSGTPCQVAAVNRFVNIRLGEIPKNLITIDLICHGTPSPVIFKDYTEWLEREFQSRICDFDFRSKKKGWRDFSILAKFENGKEYNSRQNIDPYFILFFHNFILKPCCYKCAFTKKDRVSDITIGDFWNVENIDPLFSDDIGSSIVSMSEKGNIFFNNIPNDYESTKVEWDSYFQPQLYHPVNRNKRYEDYWCLYNNKGFEYSIKKFADYNFFGKRKRNIINFLVKSNIYPFILKIVKRREK